MPSPPRLILPPVLFARVEALRAAAHPAPPSRQAVVEAALGRGLEALAGLPPGLVPALAPHAWALLRALPGCGVPGCWRAATRGHAYSPAAADLRCDDCDPAGPGEASQWGDLAYAAVVRAAVVGAEQAARGGADGREGVPRASDAPRGATASAIAPPVARALRGAGLRARVTSPGVVTVTGLSESEADAMAAENDRRWPTGGGAVG